MRDEKQQNVSSTQKTGLAIQTSILSFLRVNYALVIYVSGKKSSNDLHSVDGNLKGDQK